VFPTGVGMNRLYPGNSSWVTGVPHRRGDEPGDGADPGPRQRVFPTGVGMNRNLDHELAPGYLVVVTPHGMLYPQKLGNPLRSALNESCGLL